MSTAASANTPHRPAMASTTKPSSKSHKGTKIITLHLPSTLLSKFPSSVIASSSSSSTIDAASSNDANATATVASPVVADAVGDAATKDALLAAPPSAGGIDAATNGMNGAKKKGVPGPKPGMKRTNSQLNIDGVPKPRGKPGPKKKAKVDSNGAPLLNPPAPAAPKLGPKANQGAINACLRALDRTGKPCRKWDKAPFSVKSFTGSTWGAKTWASNRKPVDFGGDVKSDSSSLGSPGSGVSGRLSEGGIVRLMEGVDGADVDVKGMGLGMNGVESSAVGEGEGDSGSGDMGTPMGNGGLDASSPAPVRFVAVNPV
ncbi:DUF1711-domain-containing protein [Tothia fuscella]|uniref:DUF1711-domain-containing protein n=1 Tax=Tothia fuscella TaxID=1048955 RepID=A0A9P4NQ63_9PEZI|nr:DUF1711-domain-containing protein [Tothia fuscella]